MESAKVATDIWRLRNRKMSRRRTVAGALLFCYILMVAFVASLFFLVLGGEDADQPSGNRRTVRSLADWSVNVSTSATSSSSLAKVVNSSCTPPAIEQFPRPLISREIRLEGGLVLHFLVCLYMFLALAVVCDEYFVPSLQSICEALKMEEDVAGATFMAAGSSAPELATSVIAVFIAKDDIGVGTVLGSAVYNVAFVIAVCGLFAGKSVYLHWWPMVRDCVFYTISIIAMLLVIMDGQVTWIESLLFLLLYVAYIVFMFFNERAERWMTGLKDKKAVRMEEAQLMSYRVVSLEVPASNETISTNQEKVDLEEAPHGVFDMPDGVFHRILWLLSVPVFCCTYLTIPDCRKERWKKWFAVAFISSCIWISLQSYLLVWMITIIGDTLGIPDTVMGLTFLAAGVSVPDAIASLIVAREGFGDMAISNAIGSNVFDILMCLGLPWFLQTAIIEPGNTVPVQSKGLMYTTITLIATVIFLLVATHLNGWKLNKRYGFVMLVWYLAFMVVASLYELNVFGQFNPPNCPSDY